MPKKNPKAGHRWEVWLNGKCECSTTVPYSDQVIKNMKSAGCRIVEYDENGNRVKKEVKRK